MKMKKACRRDCAGADRKPQRYCNLGTSASSKRIQRSLQQRLWSKLWCQCCRIELCKGHRSCRRYFSVLGCRNGHNVGFRSAFLCDLSGFEQAGNKQAPGPKGVTAEWPSKRDSLAIKQLADGYVML